MKLFELRVWTKTDISALAKHLSNKDLGQLPAPPPPSLSLCGKEY